jgi:hypothetical protein
MRMTAEALAIDVFVRRVTIGVSPFRWEIRSAERTMPIYVSSDRFQSMVAVYPSGRARLAEFIPKQRSMPPGTTGNGQWRSDRSNLVVCNAPLPIRDDYDDVVPQRY